MSQQTDEHAGLPSASGMERIKLCPGSFLLERACAPEPEDKDAESGRAIHEALATGDTSKLTEEQLKTYEKCKELTVECLSRIFEDPLAEGFGAVCKEHRFWLDRQ